MESQAHHIAAIIVAVHLSRYHRLRGVFKLDAPLDTSDHIVFHPEKRSVSPDAVRRAQDPEVLRERAIIDLAGHEAEEVYHIVNHLPGQGRRIGDHDALLDDAMSGIGDLDIKRSDLVKHTLELVSRNWFAVRDLARLLMLSEDRTLDSEAAVQRLGHLLPVSSDPI